MLSISLKFMEYGSHREYSQKLKLLPIRGILDVRFLLENLKDSHLAHEASKF